MLILVRHCESEGNVDLSLYSVKPDSEIDLSKDGANQAEGLVMRLCRELDKRNATDITCYSSPYLRAKKTAKPFVEFLGLPLTENDLIRERAWGSLREKVIARTHSDEDFRFFQRPEDGESFHDLYTRVSDFLSHLRSVHRRSDTIIVFTHGEWMKVAKMINHGHSIEEFEKNSRIKIPNGEIVDLGTAWMH